MNFYNENTIKKLNLNKLIDKDSEFVKEFKEFKEFKKIINYHENTINSYILVNTNYELLNNVLNIPIISANIIVSQKEKGYKREDSGYETALICFRKVFEFSLNILLSYSQYYELVEHYLEFDQDIFGDLITFYIENANDISLNSFEIKKIGNRNQIDYKDTNTKVRINFSVINRIAAVSKKEGLKSYLQIDKNYSSYKKILQGFDISSEGGGSGKGGGNWIRVEYKNENNYKDNYKIYKSAKTVNNFETRETNFCVNPIFDKDLQSALSLPIPNKINQYKLFRQAQAQGSRYAKSNAQLPSDYNTPCLNNLEYFIQNILLSEDFDNEYNDLFSNSVIIFSLFTGTNYLEYFTNHLFGINTVKMIAEKGVGVFFIEKTSKYSFLKKNEVLEKFTEELSKNSSKLRVVVPENISIINIRVQEKIMTFINNNRFLEFVLKEEFDEESLSEIDFSIEKKFEKELVEKIVQILAKDNLEEISKDDALKVITDKDILSKFQKKIKTYFTSYFESLLKKHNKKLVMSLEKLSSILYASYINTTNNSNIQMLFLKDLEYKDRSRIAYGSTNEQFYINNNWLLNFQKELNCYEKLNSYTQVKSSTTMGGVHKKYHGSPLVIKAKVFIDFFNYLELEIKKTNIKYIQHSIAMIYIRYALSLLLSTRDIENSCKLDQISNYLKLIAFKEKFSDEVQTTRIVPVCEEAYTFIQLFFNIQKLYANNDDIPFLIDKNNKTTNIVTQSQIIKWLQINLPDNKELIDFVRANPLNIGRHIISTKAYELGLSNDYLDALLDHYTSGTESFGKNSCINFDDYQEGIMNFLSKISKIYIPAFGLKLEELINE